MSTVALVHGYLGSAALATAQAEALAAQGLDVVSVTLHADKPLDPKSYTFEGLAAMVDVALGDRSGVVAMGASIGAAAAMAFAREHRDRCSAMVLITPAFLYGPRRDLAEIAHMGRDRGLDWVVDHVAGADGLRRIDHDDEAAALAALEGLAKCSFLNGRKDLVAVTQPTLIIGMPGDAVHPVEVAEAYWRHIPTSRLITLTPGDVPLWDRPDDLADTVVRFLNEVEGS